MKTLLGKTGKVLKVTPTAVLLKHENGAKRRWGQGALSRLPLTTADVDAMKVQTYTVEPLKRTPLNR